MICQIIVMDDAGNVTWTCRSVRCAVLWPKQFRFRTANRALLPRFRPNSRSETFKMQNKRACFWIANRALLPCFGPNSWSETRSRHIPKRSFRKGITPKKGPMSHLVVLQRNDPSGKCTDTHTDTRTDGQTKKFEGPYTIGPFGAINLFVWL